MKKAAGVIGLALAGASLLFCVAASAANASDLGPNQHRRRGRPDESYSVPEPGTLALLGAGLVSLGLFAKHKLAKRP